MQKLSIKQLANRLALSEKLSEEVHQLWQAWEPTGKSPSLAMFQGDVYDGLDFESLTFEEQSRALDQSFIASAVYGILRGSDGICPYRLDLNDKVKIGSSSLTAFWKKKKDDFNLDTELLVDLTSSEYTPLIPITKNIEVIRVDFKEEKAGMLKTVSFFSKKARGLYARWLIQSQLTDTEQLTSFKEEGYDFNESASNDKLLVFSRKA